MILVFTEAFAVAWSAVFGVRTRRGIVAGLLLAAFIVHWQVEGLRWQMLPVYGAALGLAIGDILSVERRLDWTRRIARGVFGLAGVALGAILPLILPVPDIPVPTGPEPIAARPADRSAAASRSDSGATTTTEAATTAQGSGDGPKNLLANASFENGPEGWNLIGAARLTRSTDAHLGAWSLRILPESSADGPVGITVPNVTLTKPQGRYHTNAWVRPSSPNTTVTIGLREYRGGQPVPGSNTLGWTVEQTGWRKFGAIHVASQPGSRLALEIMARDLPPGGYLDIDEVVLHLLGNR